MWGGEGGDAVKILPAEGDGLYNPLTDAWRPTSTAGQPMVTEMPNAAWTGSDVIVWGCGPGWYGGGTRRRLPSRYG